MPTAICTCRLFGRRGRRHRLQGTGELETQTVSVEFCREPVSSSFFCTSSTNNCGNPDRLGELCLCCEAFQRRKTGAMSQGCCFVIGAPQTTVSAPIVAPRQHPPETAPVGVSSNGILASPKTSSESTCRKGQSLVLLLFCCHLDTTQLCFPT